MKSRYSIISCGTSHMFCWTLPSSGSRRKLNPTHPGESRATGFGQSSNMLMENRMDDLDSAIYYSAWNACIAETVKRFPVDIYHINDYHGAAAPLYLLPQTIPCCLSLHNAEFQGLWPIRTKEEQQEVCKAFNLSVDVVEKYVQFGEVFNLLHAGGM